MFGTRFSRIFGISSLSGGYQDLLLGFYQVFTLNSVGISKFQREKSTRNLPENIGKTYKIPIIVIYIQLACEIDIRTLTSHQVFGTRKDGRGGGGGGRFFGIRKDGRGGAGNTVLQVYWDRKYSVQFYWDRKRLHANYFSFFQSLPKNRLPANY